MGLHVLNCPCRVAVGVGVGGFGELDIDDGGVDVPQDTDGVTRYPSVGGSPLPADDLDKYQGNEPEGDDK